MIKKHLALSSDFHYWSDEDHNILLGKWCLKNKNIKHLYKYKHSIMKDIWDDDKYDSKVSFCNTIHNVILKHLSTSLNTIHDEDLSVRSWDIIVGWWLLFHIQNCYDRYHLIKSGLEQNPTSCNILTLPANHFIPADSLEYTKFIYNDLRNFFLLSWILNEFKHRDLECRSIEAKPQDVRNFEELKTARLHRNQTISYQGQSFKYTFAGARFSPITLRKILNENGHEELPYYRYGFELNLKLREELLSKYQPQSHFEQVCISLLRNQMPASFLENFGRNIEATSINYPKNTGIIYTANSILTDDAFKIWTTKQIEKNKSILALGQHSNVYGNLHNQSAEEYERRIADVYVTWGWEEDKKTTALPPLSLKPFYKGFSFNLKTSDKIIFVDVSYSLFKSWLYSLPQGSDHWETIQDVSSFYTSLNTKLLEKFEHRLYPANFGWDEGDILRSKFPNLKLTNANGEISFKKQLKSGRICVLNYHSMVLSECIAADYPVICFWNFESTKLRQGIKYLYQNLEDVGILHSSPKSAAEFIDKNYHNIETWWYDEKTIKAKKAYASKFCRSEHEPEKAWANFFNQLMVKHEHNS
jgi:putative transferase (TIGR04331 family)